MEIAEIKGIKCVHCGEDCENDAIYLDNKYFCCSGCKLVYEILAEKDMCAYYDLDKNAGISLKNKNFGEKYAFLDNDKIAHRLADFADENTFKISLFIPSIHCSSCIWLLENLYRLREGINQSRVNFVEKTIALTFNPQVISLRQIAELLATIGYEAQINLENLQKKTQNAENRDLFLKIGITGFCLGNLMMLSFADYLALEDFIGQREKIFFGLLSILLALPLIFYSSADYFKSAFQSLRIGIINLDVPISLGILTLFGRSIFEILAGVGMGYLDSLAGLIFFLLVGRWFQSKTYQSFSFERDYQSYFPLAVSVRKGNILESKIAAELQVGDRLCIKNQELIPADCILLSSRACIDYSFVTGEAEPLLKKEGDYIYAGGRQVGESIDLEVQKAVSQSYLTQLWNNEIFQKTKTQGKIEKQIQAFGFYFTYVTLLIATFAGLYWYWADASQIWNVVTAVLIIACPCALTLAMPFVLGNMMRIFGRKHFYLKNYAVIQSLAHINHVVFDKTGTITQAQSTKIHFEGNPLCEGEKVFIKSLCSHSTHPLSRRITEYFKEIPTLNVNGFYEIANQGILGQVNEVRVEIGKIKKNQSNKTEVGIWIEDAFRGKFVFENQYRAGLGDLLKDLQRQGIQTSLISGDNDSEKAALQTYFGEDNLLYFNQSPQEKLDLIAQWQTKGDKVLMLGDGLNDAGALQQSEIGIALAEDTTAFVPACSAILGAEYFEKLPQFIQLSKQAIWAVKMSFLLSLVYNFVGLSLAVSGVLYAWVAALLMPLSSASVAVFAVLLTNYLSAKGLNAK